MTGVEFNQEFDRITDKSYTDYYGAATKNQFFKRVLLYTIEDIYRGLDAQLEYDEISSLISTNTPVTPRGDVLYIKPIIITSLNIVGTTATVVTNQPHFGVSGETIGVSTTGFSPAISGEYIITVITPNSFSFTVPPTTGALISGSVTTKNTVADYQHNLQSKAAYHIETLVGISGITDNQPIKITLNKMSRLRQGDRVKVILGQTQNAANGTFYLKSNGKNAFSLFVDQDLTIPAIGNIPYVASPSDRVVIEVVNTTIPIVSDIRGQSIDPPTKDYPRFEIANNAIKYYPQGVQSVLLDYIKISPVQIDQNDNVIDLEQYYTQRFLLRAADKGALLFAQEIKDVQMNQMSAQRIIQN